MNIDIYSIYKIEIESEYNYLSEENESIYDNIFETEKIKNKDIINGGALIDVIKLNISRDYIDNIYIKDNTIKISTFNFNTGETSSVKLKIERVKENEY